MRTSLLLIALVLLLASCGGGGGGTQHPAPIVTPPVDLPTLLDIESSVSYDNYETIGGVEYKHAFVTFTNTATEPLRFYWGWKEHEEAGGIITHGATGSVTLDAGQSKMLAIDTCPATSDITIILKNIV